MTEFMESSGRTEEDAIEKALETLKLERDDVSVEVIQRAKTGFLGFGAQQAKVKITYEVPEPKVVEKPKAVKPKVKEEIPKKKAEIPKEKESKPEESKEKSQKPLPKEEKPKAKEDSGKEKPNVSTKVEKNVEKPTKVEKKSPKEKGRNHSKEPLTPEEIELLKEGISKYLDGLLPLLHVEAKPVCTFEGENFLVKLEGENLGALIGRRGETLDAIQQMTSYSVNKICPKKIRIFMDAENYREKREETLIKLANKVAEEAVKHRRNVSLESMNAYERHIIHTALENYPNISTYSTGNDPNRRTVVAYRGNKN